MYVLKVLFPGGYLGQYWPTVYSLVLSMQLRYRNPAVKSCFWCLIFTLDSTPSRPGLFLSSRPRHCHFRIAPNHVSVHHLFVHHHDTHADGDNGNQDHKHHGLATTRRRRLGLPCLRCFGGGRGASLNLANLIILHHAPRVFGVPDVLEFLRRILAGEVHNNFRPARVVRQKFRDVVYPAEEGEGEREEKQGSAAP